MTQRIRSDASLKTILITGVTSCSGLHAVRHLESVSDVHVHGTARVAVSMNGLQRCHVCDFLSPEDIHRVISDVRPDQILHLAASSDPSDPNKLLQTNISGVWNLLEACEKLNREVDVLIVGSAASFGEMHQGEVGLGSNRVCEPGSLYGVSRQTQTEMGRIADGNNGLKVFLCRTFNLIGPGISDRYVPTALAARIQAAVEQGASELELRDMDGVRDFIDVRDAVAAYFAILEHGQTGHPYSVGSGEPVTIGQLADVLAAEQGAAIRFKEPEITPGKSRSGIKRSVADATDLQKDTGWAPRFTLCDSVRDMLTTQ
mgnify:CR=1 FL=1